jgi:hypothetical protein
VLVWWRFDFHAQAPCLRGGPVTAAAAAAAVMEMTVYCAQRGACVVAQSQQQQSAQLPCVGMGFAAASLRSCGRVCLGEASTDSSRQQNTLGCAASVLLAWLAVLRCLHNQACTSFSRACCMSVRYSQQYILVVKSVVCVLRQASIMPASSVDTYERQGGEVTECSRK